MRVSTQGLFRKIILDNAGRIILQLFFLLCYVPASLADTLVIEPEMGRAPLLSALQKAHSQINVVIYGLTDKSFINALIAEKNARKNVNILIESAPYKNEKENINAIRQLQAANINIQYPDEKFQLLHQKTILFDRAYALIMTFNLTKSTFNKERNFGLITSNPDIIKEISTVFNKDWQHHTISVHHIDLVWSPDNSREKIVSFLHSAKKEIKIYADNITDYEIIGALARIAQSGIKVKILTSHFSPKSPKYLFLKKNGVDIRLHHQYIIHAKVINIDNRNALLGSINFTSPSINNNRELSIITHDLHVVKQLTDTFNHDWEMANLH